MLKNTAPSPEQLLALIEAAIRDAPPLVYEEGLTQDDIKWLGRADALIEASGAISASINFRVARQNLGNFSHSRNALLIPLQDAYSRLELSAPPAAQGRFIAAGDTWNGYAAIFKLIQSGCDDLLLIDPYVTSSLFIDFTPHVNSKSGLRCLTSRRSNEHLSLITSAAKWASDKISEKIRVDVRYAPKHSLHDRLMIIDKKEVWIITQSLKDIAKKSPVSVTQAETELAAMKAQHYESLWDKSELIA